jgi:hypothetical protein
MALIGGVLIVVAGIFLVAWMGGEAARSFGELITWLGAQWPGSPRLTPLFVIVSLLAAQRLLLGPLKFAHARINRESPSRKGLQRAARWSMVLSSAAFLFDRATLLLLLRAVHSQYVGWPAAASALAFPRVSVGSRLFLVAGLSLVQFLICVLVLMGVMSWFPRLMGIGQLDRGSGFVGRYGAVFNAKSNPDDDPPQILGTGAASMLFDPALYVVLIFVYPRSPFLMTILLCSVLLRVLGYPLVQLISMWLDWHNDLWAARLARDLTADPQADRRLKAAEKLNALAAFDGRWIRPVRPNLETATKDSDARVRAAAQGALAAIK